MHMKFPDQLSQTATATMQNPLSSLQQQPGRPWMLIPSLLALLICTLASLFGLAPHLAHADEQAVAPTVLAADIASLTDPDMTTKEFSQRIVPFTRSELGEVAKVWLKLSQEEVARITSIDLALPDSNEADRKRLEADLADAVERQDRLFRKFGVLVNEWEAKGGKAEEVAEYRQYIVAVRRKQAEVYDASTLWKLFKTWLTSPEGGVQLGWLLVSIFLWLMFAFSVAYLVALVMRRSLSTTRRMSRLLADFLSGTAFWLILFIGIVIVLSAHGINMTPLLAAFGGASFVIAFATQSTLSNLASGLLLMVSRPFDIGDSVDVAGESGRIRSVSIVSTSIQSEDGQLIVVPNKMVWESVIVNRSANQG
jgi:small conductance mechanosensitive channel